MCVFVYIYVCSYMFINYIYMLYVKHIFEECACLKTDFN